MSFNHEISPPSNRRAEALFDEVRFDELYNLAVDLCLKDAPNRRNGATNVSPEAEVLQRLGLRGLRAAFHGIAEPVLMESYSDEQSEADDDLIMLEGRLPILEPDLLGGSPNKRVQDRIESFGEQLLAESFKCLGTDAKSHIEAFRNAQTDSEQIAELQWLHKRIHQMTAATWRRLRREASDHTLRAVDEIEADAFYHPVRLSPKATGVYPNHHVEPTCLAISTMTASFCMEAGAGVLHAGVLRNRRESLEQTYRVALYQYGEDAAEYGNEFVASSLKNNAHSLRYDRLNRGFHAVTYAKLKSGAWYCIDPNFDKSYLLTDEHSAQLDTAKQHIDETSRLSAGLEIPLYFGSASIIETAYSVILHTASVEIDTEALRELIVSNDPDQLHQRAYSIVLSSVKLLASDGSEVEDSKNLFEFLSDKDIGIISESPEDNERSDFVNLWTKYVMWGDSPAEFLKRCNKDAGYLERRLDDAQVVVMMFILNGARRSIAEDELYGIYPDADNIYHAQVEVGRPAHRIACAVLSDIATYCDVGPTAEFWRTYWPSSAPLTEYVNSADFVDTGKTELPELAARWVLVSGSDYAHQASVIRKLQDANRVREIDYAALTGIIKKLQVAARRASSPAKAKARDDHSGRSGRQQGPARSPHQEVGRRRTNRGQAAEGKQQRRGQGTRSHRRWRSSPPPR